MRGRDRRDPVVVVLSIILIAAVACFGTEMTPPVVVQPSAPQPVTPPPPASIAVYGLSTTPLIKGATVQLMATPLNTAGLAVSCAPISWHSSDTSLVTVSDSGKVTAVHSGTVTITATCDNVQGTAGVTVAEDGDVITASGGTVTVFGGTVTVTVPAGALTGPIVVMVTQSTSTPPAGQFVPGTAFFMLPNSVNFTHPATVSLRYDPALIPTGVSESTLQLYISGDGAWRPVTGSTVNTITKTVTGNVPSLGTFAVAGAPIDHISLSGQRLNGAIAVGQSNPLSATAFDCTVVQVVLRSIHRRALEYPGPACSAGGASH